jgi:hypothetical protein
MGWFKKNVSIHAAEKLAKSKLVRSAVDALVDRLLGMIGDVSPLKWLELLNAISQENDRRKLRG